MRNREVYLKEGELVMLIEINDQKATIFTSNSIQLIIPTELLISQQDYNNLLDNKTISIMNAITENKSKFIFVKLNYSIIY
jgi:hypothetical protein